jgi:hypothetical protein
MAAASVLNDGEARQLASHILDSGNAMKISCASKAALALQSASVGL